jgi:phosphoglycolate phosphatase
MKYKLIIFDFDGTLADSFPWLVSILDQVAEQFGYEKPEAEHIDQLRKLHARDMMKRYNVSIWRMFSLGRYVQKRMKRDIHQIELFAGIEEVIQLLAEREIRLAVVTSNSYHNVCRVLGPQIAELIDHYECGVSLLGKRSKFRKVLRKTGVQPGEALCIGDEIRDIEAARDARIPFGAVAWGYTHLDALLEHAPQEVFASVGEMAEKLA